MRKSIITILAVVGLTIGAAQAQQYGLLTTLESHQATNGWATGTASNLAAVVTLTKWDEFVLEVINTCSNAVGAGTMSIQWDVSADGVNYPGTSGTVDGKNRGWFSIPITNANQTIWTTNITVNSIGYWRANWVTNIAGQFSTNLTIKAYAKPKRQG